MDIQKIAFGGTVSKKFDIMDLWKIMDLDEVVQTCSKFSKLNELNLYASFLNLEFRANRIIQWSPAVILIYIFSVV